MEKRTKELLERLNKLVPGRYWVEKATDGRWYVNYDFANLDHVDWHVANFDTQPNLRAFVVGLIITEGCRYES